MNHVSVSATELAGCVPLAGPPTAVRVVAGDDHPLWLRALNAVLTGREGITVVGSATSAEDLVRLCERLQPDVVVSDYSFPDGNAVDVLERLEVVAPGSRVVVLSSFAEADLVRQAVAHGAVGYLVKTSPLDDLAEQLQVVAQGGVAFCEETTRALADTLRAAAGVPKTPVDAGDCGLSPRESSVLALAAQGHTDDAIARRLGVSRHTVRTHLTRAFSKLGARNRAEAVARAGQRGLLDQDGSTRPGPGSHPSASSTTSGAWSDGLAPLR